jgi:hypothetical protein
MAFDQDFGYPSNLVRAPNPVVWNRHIHQASDRSAIHTDEMGVATAVVIWIADFESPHMVTQLGTNDEFRIGQIR